MISPPFLDEDVPTEPRTPAKPRLSVRAVVVGLVLAVVVYTALVAVSDLQGLASALGRFQPEYGLGAIGLVIVAYVLRALRWQAYLGRGGSRVDFATSWWTFLAGFALGVTPGKLGELVKTYYVWRRAATPYATSFAAALAERAMDVAAVVALFCVGLMLDPVVDPRLGYVLLAIAIVAMLVLRSRFVARPVLRSTSRLPFVGRFVARLGAVHDRLVPMLSGAALAYGPILSLGAWGAETLAVWTLARGLGLDLAWAPVAVAFTAASLGGALTFLPGGLGATEGGMVAILRLEGVDPASAGALTLLARAATLWFSLLVGLLAIAVLRLPRARAAARPDEGTEAL